jgi:hypothetical protein
MLQAKGSGVDNADLAGLEWRKSSACFESNCVAVAACRGIVMIRDTGEAGNKVLTFSYRDWCTFIARVHDDVR